MILWATRRNREILPLCVALMELYLEHTVWFWPHKFEKKELKLKYRELYLSRE